MKVGYSSNRNHYTAVWNHCHIPGITQFYPAAVTFLPLPRSPPKLVLYLATLEWCKA